jgi:hypothetical protein
MAAVGDRYWWGELRVRWYLGRKVCRYEGGTIPGNVRSGKACDAFRNWRVTGVDDISAARSTGRVRTGPRELPLLVNAVNIVRFGLERVCAVSLRKRDEDCNNIGTALIVD